MFELQGVIAELGAEDVVIAILSMQLPTVKVPQETPVAPASSLLFGSVVGNGVEMVLSSVQNSSVKDPGQEWEDSTSRGHLRATDPERCKLFRACLQVRVCVFASGTLWKCVCVLVLVWRDACVQLLLTCCCCCQVLKKIVHKEKAVQLRLLPHLELLKGMVALEGFDTASCIAEIMHDNMDILSTAGAKTIDFFFHDVVAKLNAVRAGWMQALSSMIKCDNKAIKDHQTLVMKLFQEHQHLVARLAKTDSEWDRRILHMQTNEMGMCTLHA